MKLQFDPEARAELMVAAEHYEACRSGLGQRFVDGVENAVERLRSHPLLYGFMRRPYRRCRVKGFPYSVIYRVDEEGIYIAAVSHTSRRPGYWMSRPDQDRV